MYEILSAIILAIICYVIYRQAKDIETIVQSSTEFYTAYAEYVKAVAAHTEYLEKNVNGLEDKLLESKQMIEYIDKRLIGVEQNAL